MPTAPMVLLVLFAVAPGAAGGDLDLHLQTGWQLLDAGRNAEAARLFASLLDSTSAGLAAARGLAEARRRSCDHKPDPTPFPSGPGLVQFAAGVAHQDANDFAAADAAFRAAATVARARGDPRGAAAALLESADCCLQDGRFADADARLEELRELRPQLPPAAAAGCEIALAVRTAGVHYLAGRHAVADSIYGAAADAALAAGRTTDACDAINGCGIAASRRRRPDLSLPAYRRALTLARRLRDARRQAKILLNLAYDETQARDFVAAARTLAEAHTLIVDCGFERMLGRYHTGQGALDEGRGDRDAAMEHFRAAWHAFAAVEDEGGELGARQWLAYNLMMTGYYGAAVRHYERCLDISARRGSPQGLNWVLAGLALTNHRLGYLDRAEDFYLRAIALNAELGDSTSVAWCHQSLGGLEVLRGNYREAIVHTRVALEICQELGDPGGTGEVRVALALIHFRLGDWDQALAEYEAAVEIARRQDLEELLQAAVTGLAAVWAAAGQPEKARASCEEGLAIARRWRDENAVIWALVQLAELALDTGDDGAARRHIAAAEARLGTGGSPVLRSRARLAAAHCTDDPSAAVVLAQEALDLAEDGGLPEQEWTCLTELGALTLAAGDTAGALAALERAIEVVESLRRNVGSDDLRRHMLRSALTPYERVIDTLAAGGSPTGVRRAFAYAERSRAQILAERLRTALAGGDTAAVGAEERDVLASIGYCQRRLQEPGLPDTVRADLKRRVADLEAAYLLLTLSAPDKDERPVAYSVTPPDPAALLAIPRPDETVAAYFLGRDTSWLFLLADGEVTATRLPARKHIESRVRRYLALRESAATPPTELAAATLRLHELLLAPVFAGRAAPELLVIIPDGLLHRVPFAALAGAQGPLVGLCPSFTAPSLQTLDYLRRREQGRRMQRGAPPIPVVAVGYGGPKDVTRLHPHDDRPFAPLAEADEEARQVARLYRDGVLLTGEIAGEAALRAAPLRDAAILHLAVHGDADDRDVRRSFIVLGRGEGSGDGLLQWGEAASLDLGASLVTLASCRSAQGVLAVGEGVTGLTEAFLFAGGTCVLAAQTDVGDASTRRFMSEFYRHLREGAGAADALRTAQLAALATDGAGHTRWAEFVLVGDGTVTVPSDVPAARWHRTLVVGAGLVFVLVAVSVALLRRRA